MTATSGRTDQQRVALEEERDLLLRSLDDLDAEYAAGDLEQHDYETLRDSYTQRAAEVLRQLGSGEAGAAGVATTGAAVAASGPTGWGRLTRRLLIGGGFGVFALVAGLALAQGLGERGVNDGLTGAVDPTSRTRVLECQTLGSTGGDLLGAIKCFDDVLAVDPENAEALTYRGWYLVLAAGSIQQSSTDTQDQADAEALVGNALSYLDKAIAADPELPDPRAFRAVVYDRMGRADDACAEVAQLLALDPPPFFVTQTSGIVSRNNCPT